MIPASLKRVLTQPAMTVREAGFGAPLTVGLCMSMFLDIDQEVQRFHATSYVFKVDLRQEFLSNNRCSGVHVSTASDHPHISKLRGRFSVLVGVEAPSMCRSGASVTCVELAAELVLGL